MPASLFQNLTNARLRREHGIDKEVDEVADHFTYWTAEQASRIDRFYVPTEWLPRVIWVTARNPPQYSDQQEVVLHLRDLLTKEPPRHQARHTYPIRSDKPERVLYQMLVDMGNMGIRREITTRNWDTDNIECANLHRGSETARKATS